jgi:S1-C subfamily serine protease
MVKAMSVIRRVIAASLLAASLVSASHGSAQIPATVSEGQTVPSLAPLLRGITPSVVSIAVRRRMTEEESALMNDPLLQDPRVPPMPPGDRDIYAAGSGVIIDADQGFIVTGNHVVDGADEILVILTDGRRLPATTAGSDKDTDIAVVRVQAKGLTSIRMGDSDRVEVGDFVLAIGNPFSIGQTVTSGIVSALRRRSWGDQGYEDFIQTDAAINLGSSGGALVNLRGELVGMNSAILDTGDPMGGNVGIGFAIPVNTVRNIAGQLMKYGAASHGQLGISVAAPAIDPFQPSTVSNRTGIVITRVDPASSAAQAGLRVGDTIVTLNSSPLRDAADLQIKTALLRAGEMVELSIIRDGRALSVRATLAPRSEKKTLNDASPASFSRVAAIADGSSPAR